jgi:hypothetical protein
MSTKMTNVQSATAGHRGEPRSCQLGPTRVFFHRAPGKQQAQGGPASSACMDTTPLQERELACESHHEYRHFYRGSTTESSEFSAIPPPTALRRSIATGYASRGPWPASTRPASRSLQLRPPMAGLARGVHYGPAEDVPPEVHQELIAAGSIRTVYACGNYWCVSRLSCVTSATQVKSGI